MWFAAFGGAVYLVVQNITWPVAGPIDWYIRDAGLRFGSVIAFAARPWCAPAHADGS